MPGPYLDTGFFFFVEGRGGGGGGGGEGGLVGGIPYLLGFKGLGFRVQASNNWVLGAWLIIVVVQVLGRYMNIRYLDP